MVSFCESKREISVEMKDYKRREDRLSNAKIVRVEPLKGSSRLDKPLFHTAIYVNRAPTGLRKASHGKDTSDPLMEGKPWTKGERLLTQARDTGRELALIFGYYERLEYWAVAREIVVETNGEDKRVTRYRFAELRRIRGRRRERKDLTVVSTNRPLPNDFIKSYVLVQAPGFLQSGGTGAKIAG
jgi:hypothetical protein